MDERLDPADLDVAHGGTRPAQEPAVGHAELEAHEQLAHGLEHRRLARYGGRCQVEQLDRRACTHRDPADRRAQRRHVDADMEMLGLPGGEFGRLVDGRGRQVADRLGHRRREGLRGVRRVEQPEHRSHLEVAPACFGAGRRQIGRAGDVHGTPHDASAAPSRPGLLGEQIVGERLGHRRHEPAKHGQCVAALTRLESADRDRRPRRADRHHGGDVRVDGREPECGGRGGARGHDDDGCGANRQHLGEVLGLAGDAVVVGAGRGGGSRSGDGHEPCAVAGGGHDPGRSGGARTSTGGVDHLGVTGTPIRVAADVHQGGRGRRQPGEHVAVAACRGRQLVVREARHRDGVDVRRHRRGGSDHTIRPGPPGDELIQPVAEVVAGEQQVTEIGNLHRRPSQCRGEHLANCLRIGVGRVGDAIDRVDQVEGAAGGDRNGRAGRRGPGHDRGRPRLACDGCPPRQIHASQSERRGDRPAAQHGGEHPERESQVAAVEREGGCPRGDRDRRIGDQRAERQVRADSRTRADAPAEQVERGVDHRHPGGGQQPGENLFDVVPVGRPCERAGGVEARQRQRDQHRRGGQDHAAGPRRLTFEQLESEPVARDVYRESGGRVPRHVDAGTHEFESGQPEVEFRRGAVRGLQSERGRSVRRQIDVAGRQVRVEQHHAQRRRHLEVGEDRCRRVRGERHDQMTLRAHTAIPSSAPAVVSRTIRHGVAASPVPGSATAGSPVIKARSAARTSFIAAGVASSSS